jgi:hypothetical protein
MQLDKLTRLKAERKQIEVDAALEALERAASGRASVAGGDALQLSGDQASSALSVNSPRRARSGNVAQNSATASSP